MSSLEFISYTIGSLVGLSTLAVSVVKTTKWGYRKARQSEITHDFVVAMATNHLPHIYHGLELIADKLEIEMTDPPAIKYTAEDFSN